jgi:zinc ribbon protein
MICQACGNPVAAGVHFCSRCGAAVVAAEPVPPPNPAAYPPAYSPAYAMRPPRVQRHLQTLGILWCVFGAYRVLSGLIGLFVMRVMTFRNFGDPGWGWGWGGHFHGAPWMALLFPFIAVVSVVTAFLAFLVGFGLLQRKSWGRVLGIVLAILALLKFPVGTALGIYTLWVLVPAESAMEYEAIADHS